MDHELERRNLRLGIALFVTFLILFGLTVVVAFVYLALD
jgi:fatty acid desaturase